MSITVIIPTFNRLEYLKITLNSCYSQSLLPDAIIVSDDSKDDVTENWILNEKLNSSVPLKYIHNKPALGQGENVDSLIRAVDTDLLLLIHDDDYLLTDALEDLNSILKENSKTDVVFGKQYLINQNGVINKSGTEKLNKTFSRDESYEGKDLNPYSVLLRQQLPSNSFLIKTELAKKIGYGKKEFGGNGVDFHFCYKLAINEVNFKFVNRFISYYRDSADGVSKTTDSAFYAFQLVEKLNFDAEFLNTLRNDFLKYKAAIAITQALNNGLKKEALSIYFSRYHRREILTLGGLKRLQKLVINV
ncbi:glycosyltransferase family 2 protein [Leeuwenhoekiella sp. LLG6367-2.1]|uniref:glycosyltransferase family 2 protein n=1 Tax=Leeuwenhoekiella sp. LLG6367-2.1 TaxID=3160833 RepID=UPI00386E47BD